MDGRLDHRTFDQRLKLGAGLWGQALYLQDPHQLQELCPGGINL